MWQQLFVESPQACLSIVNLKSGGYTVYKSCHRISKPASKRNAASEFSAAKDKSIGVLPSNFAQFHRIFRPVLSICIDSYDYRIWTTVFFYISQTGFQRGSFSQVFLMREDDGLGSDLIEHFEIVSSAAVINNDNQVSVVRKIIQKPDQRRPRLIGRNEYNILSIIHTITSGFESPQIFNHLIL